MLHTLAASVSHIPSHLKAALLVDPLTQVQSGEHLSCRSLDVRKCLDSTNQDARTEASPQNLGKAGCEDLENMC